ncbi:MAG: ArnT family glycosyltransferase [Nitrososphaerales archaeon]
MYKARWFELIFVSALFFVCVAIRGFDLSALIAAPDEFTYGQRAIDIVAANWSWPITAMWDQPPLQIYLLAMIVAVSGATLDSLRWLSVIAGSITVVLAYYLGKSMYGRTTGFVAAVAMAVDGYAILYSRQIYIEALANMLIFGALLFFWEGVVKKKGLKFAILGGVIFGLALDSKYIAMVMGVSLVLFLILYSNKFQKNFPKREAGAFFGTSLVVFSPVVSALAVNNVNPFYFDLVYRFQLHQVNALAVQIRSGQLFYVGFRNFVQVFFHVSSSNPYGVFPSLVFDIPVWTIVVVIIIAFYVVSFFMRKSLPDGLLLILFVAFLVFAFTYPGKRSYFSLYSSLIFLVMVGRVFQLCVQTVRKYAGRKSIMPYLGVAMISLIAAGVAFSFLAVPTTYKSGFGDWDEIVPIVNYVSGYRGHNTYIATSLGEIGYYVELSNLNVSITSLKQAQEYYSESPLNQSLQTPTKGSYPIYYVISTAAIEKIRPDFIIMPTTDYQSTSTAFHLFIQERYFNPLNTVHILLFQIRSTNQSDQNFTACC